MLENRNKLTINIIYSQIAKYLSNDRRGSSHNFLTLVVLKIFRARWLLYFAAPIDRVNNVILILKRLAIEFTPGLLQLITDYLHDHQQFVRPFFYEFWTYHAHT